VVLRWLRPVVASVLLVLSSLVVLRRLRPVVASLLLV
jgi:hypothetical protein